MLTTKILTLVTVIFLATIPATAVGGPPPQLKCLGSYATIRGSANGEVIFGTGGINVIRAGKGNDIVFANGGRDKVCGGAGNDTLYGGEQYDRVDGGTGNDLCIAEVVRRCERP